MRQNTEEKQQKYICLIFNEVYFMYVYDIDINNL